MFRVSQMLAGKSRHVLGAGGLWSAGGRAASVAGCERFSTGSSMQKQEKESPPSITIEVSEGDEELVEEEEEVVTDSMQPRLIVKELDKNIVGQAGQRVHFDQRDMFVSGSMQDDLHGILFKKFAQQAGVRNRAEDGHDFNAGPFGQLADFHVDPEQCQFGQFEQHDARRLAFQYLAAQFGPD